MDPKTNPQSHTEKRANYETTEAGGGKLALVEARTGKVGGIGGGGDAAWLKQKLQPAGSNVSWPASLISLSEKARFLAVTARHWHSWDVDVRSKSCSLETSQTVMVPLCLLGLIIAPPSRHHTPDPRLTGHGALGCRTLTLLPDYLCLQTNHH